MPSPFPGMDPYIEEPGGWLDFHNRFTPYLCDDLNAIVGKGYVARLTERVIVEIPGEGARGIYPDVTLVQRKPSRGGTAIAEHDAAILVKAPSMEYVETGIEIRARKGNRVVTAIELLSPSNKTSGGDGRKAYLAKQAEVLSSDVHFVEIDLLRAGEWTVACPEKAARSAGAFDYLVAVSRAHSRHEFEIYPIPLDRRLPRIAIPLARPDPDAVADLQSLLDRCYDRGRYSETIDYSANSDPPLADRWARWAKKQLGRGKRARPRRGGTRSSR